MAWMNWINRYGPDDKQPEETPKAVTPVSEPETIDDIDWAVPEEAVKKVTNSVGQALGAPVDVETSAFTARAFNMYSMPGLLIKKIMETPGQDQIPMMMELFRLAIIDPKKASELEILSFDQYSEAMGQWVEKSRPGGSSA